MNTQIKKLLVAASICSALFVSGSIAAQTEVTDGNSRQMTERMTHKMHGQSFKKMARKLGFSEEQKTQAKMIKKESKTQMMALKPALKAFKEQVNVLMSAESFDEQAFIKLQASNQDVFAAKALILAQTKFKMKKMLTQEQQEKLASLKTKRKQRS